MPRDDDDGDDDGGGRDGELDLAHDVHAMAPVWPRLDGSLPLQPSCTPALRILFPLAIPPFSTASFGRYATAEHMRCGVPSAAEPRSRLMSFFLAQPAPCPLLDEDPLGVCRARTPTESCLLSRAASLALHCKG